jgi:peptidoglycan/LPS O-acetylase OafA/YrhL
MINARLAGASMGFDNELHLSPKRDGKGSTQTATSPPAFTAEKRFAPNPLIQVGNPPQLRANRGYRADIDGLRALAILSVVAFHAGIPHIGGGFIGVDVFFVISGYLISSHILRDLDQGTFRLKTFYERRAKRILPAFFVVVAFCYIAASLLLAPKELERFAAQAISALTSTSNIYFWRRANYFAPLAETQTLLMTWSLGVEEQFYLFFPLLMIVLHRWSRRATFLALGLLSVIALVVAIFQVRRYPAAAFYLLPSRWWELGCGTILGLYEGSPSFKPTEKNKWRQERLGIIGSLLLLLPMILYHNSTAFPGLAALPPVLGSISLISARGSWVNRKLLSLEPLAGIGLISYSWYLWHWPLLSFAHTVTGGPIPRKSAVLTVLLALILAVASYYLIERPFRRRATEPKTLLKYGLLSGLLIILGATVYGAHGFPQRYPGAAILEQEATQPDPSQCIESGASPEKLSEICRPASTPGHTLAVLGDSHASALARYLRPAGREKGWNVIEYTRTRCPQLGDVARYNPREIEESRQCRSYNHKSLNIVLADPHITTVLLGGFWSAPFGGIDSRERYVFGSNNPAEVTTEASWANFKAGLEDVTRQLQAHGKTVILTTDVPRFEFDPLLRDLSETILLRRRLMAFYGGEGSTSSGITQASEPRDVKANAIVRSVAVAYKVEFIDLRAALCKQERCRYVLDGQLLYMDSNHLSIDGARFALGEAQLFRSPLR